MRRYSIPIDRVQSIQKDHQRQLESIVPLVVVCGPTKCDADRICQECEPSEKRNCSYNLRNEIKRVLNEENCLATTFEEDFELDVASIEERIILKRDVDITFIIPDSIGSGAELALFVRDPLIKLKIRVLVPYQHHPLYSDSTSLLTSLYWELMSTIGHIYPFDPNEEHHPTGTTIASKIIQSYRLHQLAMILNEENENST